MRHDLIVEERLFSADIRALQEYDKGFDEVWQQRASADIADGNYLLEITLAELGKLCPRKYIRSLMYGRLVNFLREKGITLRILSQKNRKEKNDGRI